MWPFRSRKLSLDELRALAQRVAEEARKDGVHRFSDSTLDSYAEVLARSEGVKLSIDDRFVLLSSVSHYMQQQEADK